MTLFIDIALLIAGFVLLIKGADYLVIGASSLAKRLNFSELAIGLTIVAFGTSAPELVVNSISAFEGHSEMVFGNIIGSNIMNLLLILGTAGIIYPLSVQRSTVWKEIPFSLLVLIIFFVLANDVMIFDRPNNKIENWEALVLLGIFVGFLSYVAFSLKEEITEEVSEIEQMNMGKTLLYTFGGLAGLAFGGRMVVNNAVDIAEMFDVSQKLISLTIVAIGTSLPELATSIVASLRKKSDIAVGNIVGSNIFNVMLIIPISALIRDLEYNTVFNIDLSIVIISTVFLFVFMFTSKKSRLDRWESTLFLLSFIAYMVYVIMRK